MSKSSESLLLRYARERLLSTRIVALLALTGALAAWAAEPGTRAAMGLLAAALAAVLRIVDDLVDLPHDRVSHPHRTLVAARLSDTARASLAALAVSVLAALLWLHALLQGSSAPAALFLGALGLLYLPGVPRGARDVALLLKYPALAVMSAPFPTHALGPALAFAAVLFALEWREKRRAG